MSDLVGVLKELEQERSRLDQAIEVIGKLIGRNNTGVKVRGASQATFRTRAANNCGCPESPMGKSAACTSQQGGVGECKPTERFFSRSLIVLSGDRCFRESEATKRMA